MVTEGWGNREESQNSAQCQDACRIRCGKNPKDCQPDRHSLSFFRKYQHLATKLSRWKFKDRARSFITPGFLYHQESLDLTQPSIYCVLCSGCQKTFFIYIYYVFCFQEAQEPGSVWEAEHCRSSENQHRRSRPVTSFVFLLTLNKAE